MEIKETNLQWVSTLYKRSTTKYIVIHHTASTSDLTIKDIERIHLNENYAGVGYHFFIDKKGITWRGRPIDTIGSHALPINSISVGVCVSGNFVIEQPNQKQLDSLKEIINFLKQKYPNATIISHSQVKETKECKDEAKRTGNPLSYYATACCGKNLIKLLQEKEEIKLFAHNNKIRAFANGKWYGAKIAQNINLEVKLIEE